MRVRTRIQLCVVRVGRWFRTIANAFIRKGLTGFRLRLNETEVPLGSEEDDGKEEVDGT